MGLLKISPNAWQNFKAIYGELPIKKQNSISITELISIYINKNMDQVFGVPNKDEWGEIDTNEDLNIYK